MRYVLLAALALAACGAPESRTSSTFGESCQTTDQGNAACGAPSACFNVSVAWKMCARWCPLGCPVGTVCTVYNLCFGSCKADTDCPNGAVCHPMSGGVCVPSCTSQPTGCAAGQTCQPDGHCTGWR